MLKSLDIKDNGADIPQESEPKNLSIEMTAFLNQFLRRNPTLKGNEGSEAETNETEEVKKFRERMYYLMCSAKGYEDAAKNFEMPYIAFGEDSERKLEEAVSGNGEAFNKDLLDHYTELEKGVRIIMDGIRREGVGYLVDEDGEYKEQAAVDLDGVYGTMMFGWRELSRHTLEDKSPEYAAIDINAEVRNRSYNDYLKETPDHEKDRRLNAESLEYKREQQMIHEVMGMLTDNRKTPEDIRARMLELTKSMLLHMSDDLVGNASILFERHRKEPEKRNLVVLKDPLEQLDYMLDVIIRSVRVVRNTRVHTEMLVQGRGHSELEDAQELPSEKELIRLLG